MGLTPKQQRFVEEYLIDLNSTQAAIRAGYSRRTADKKGPHLLTIPAIKAAIDAAKLARADRAQVDADFVLARLVEEANADIKNVFGPNGDLLPVEQWPEVFRTGLVQSVDSESIKANGVEIGKVRKIRFKDRTRILELIGKHIKVNAFQETVHHVLPNGLGDRLDRAAERLMANEAEEANTRAIIDVTPPARAIAAPAEQPRHPLPATAPSEQAPVTADKPPAPSMPPAQPTAPASADWNYRPIFPAKQDFADCDYESAEASLLSSYND